MHVATPPPVLVLVVLVLVVLVLLVLVLLVLVLEVEVDISPPAPPPAPPLPVLPPPQPAAAPKNEAATKEPRARNHVLFIRFNVSFQGLMSAAGQKQESKPRRAAVCTFTAIASLPQMRTQSLTTPEPAPRIGVPREFHTA